MATLSVRYRPVHAMLRELLGEQHPDIAAQRTIQMAARPCSKRREADQPLPLALYHVEEMYPLMKVVGGIARWMQQNSMPPRFVGLSPAMLNEYWGGVNWRALRLSLYYHRFPDGKLWTVELGPMNIPDNIVYCSTKRT